MTQLAPATSQQTFRENDLLRLQRPAAASGLSENLRLQLLQALQTSLDVQTLLQLFLQHLQPIYALEGCRLETRDGQLWQAGENGLFGLDINLEVEGELLGTLVFSRDHRFLREERTQLRDLAGLVRYPLFHALEHQRVRKAMFTDELTGLNNRHAFELSLQQAMERARRQQQPLGMMVLDLDHFKQINDQLGHAEGDEVLRRVARAMEAATRDSDLLFRFGGDEFVILLPETDAEGLVRVAERLQRRIQQESHDYGKPFTISMGLATWQGGMNGAALFRQADAALYRAKGKGRNTHAF